MSVHLSVIMFYNDETSKHISTKITPNMYFGREKLFCKYFKINPNFDEINQKVSFNFQKTIKIIKTFFQY